MHRDWADYFQELKADVDQNDSLDRFQDLSTDRNKGNISETLRQCNEILKVIIKGDSPQVAHFLPNFVSCFFFFTLSTLDIDYDTINIEQCKMPLDVHMSFWLKRSDVDPGPHRDGENGSETDPDSIKGSQKKGEQKM